jgi:hypothetical protein
VLCISRRARIARFADQLSKHNGRPGADDWRKDRGLKSLENGKLDSKTPAAIWEEEKLLRADW